MRRCHLWCDIHVGRVINGEPPAPRPEVEDDWLGPASGRGAVGRAGTAVNTYCIITKHLSARGVTHVCLGFSWSVTVIEFFVPCGPPCPHLLFLHRLVQLSYGAKPVHAATLFNVKLWFSIPSQCCFRHSLLSTNCAHYISLTISLPSPYSFHFSLASGRLEQCISLSSFTFTILLLP